METMLHRMRITTDGGTDTVTWNGVVEDMEAARARFRAEMATGAYLAYAVVETETGEKRKEAIRDFVPEAEETYLVPRLVGG